MAQITAHPAFPQGGNSSKASGIAGIWITGKKGTIGLVADDNVGTYICFYGPNHRNKGKVEANPLPALVLNLDEGTRPQIQIPAGPQGVRFISLDKLLTMISRVEQLTEDVAESTSSGKIAPEVPAAVV